MSTGLITGRQVGRKFTKSQIKGLCLAASIAAVAVSQPALASTYTAAASGGNWGTSTNWTGGVPNASGAVADFSTLTLPAANTVHVGGSYTVGQLSFADQGNAYGWTLDNNGSVANVLTLAGPSTPVINVTNQSANIGVSLAGTQGFTLSGGGLLTLSGNNSYTGVTNVANGTLVLSSASSGSSGAPSGASIILDPQLSTVTTSSGAVTSVSDLSGNGNNASAGLGSGTVTLSTINGHRAFAFSGAAGLAVSTYSATTNPETVYAVIDPTTVSGPSAIFAANDGGSAGGLELRINQSKLGALNEGITGYASSTSNISAGTLSVVAYTFNSSGGTYYLNGTAIGTTAAPGLTGSGTLLIGNKESNGGINEAFVGSMGTLLVYNSAQSASTIASTSAYLATEYAASSTTLGTTLVNLSSGNSNLAIASSTQSVSSLSGVAGSNVYVGGGILSVGSDGTNTVFAGNVSDTGAGAVGTGGQLIKVGTGTLNISGGVSNSGGVAVSGGILLLSGTYSSAGPTSVTGGTLSITGTDSSSGANSVTGGIFSISGTNSASGPFSIGSTGTLVLAGPSSAGGTISFSSGGTLILQANASNTDGSGNSSAIGSPAAVTYADAATTNVQLQSDSSVTFVNAGPTGGTGSGAVINYSVNPVSNASNQTLTLGGTTGGNAGFATYQTTINVTGSNGYSLVIPSLTNANNSYITLNASGANLSIPGGVANVNPLRVSGSSNTTLGAVTGNGALLKAGTGTLLLTSSNSYTGATNIAGGTLALGVAGTLTATSAINILNGSTFDISAVPSPGFVLPSSTSTLGGVGTINGSYNHGIGILSAGFAGTTPTIGTLTINGDLTLSGGVVDVSLNGANNSTGGLANDLISVTGALNVTTPETLTVTPFSTSLPTGTTWTVLTYNAASGATGLSNLNVSTSAFTLLTNTAGMVQLKYNSGSVGGDTWTGSVNTNWDTSTTNFVASGTASPVSFTNGDNVTFNDSSSVATVNLTTSLSPNTVLVSSNTTNYIFSGSGSLTGGGILTKSGTSTLTIGTSNTYSGGTNISGGAILLNNTAGYGLGTGPLFIATGATLIIGDGAADGIIAPYNVNAGAGYAITDNGLIAYNNSSANQPPPAINGSGGLYLNVGSIGIGNVNNYSGGTVIAGGNVTAYEATSFGSGPVVGTGGTLLADFGKVFPNNFNLSGITINAGGESSSGISGTVLVSSNSTIIADGGSAMNFSGNVNFANGAILTLDDNGVGSSFSFASLNTSGGGLNVNNASVIFHNGSIGALTAQLKTAYNHGWNGSTGIFSSAAANDTTYLTALGVIQNTLNQSPSGTAYLSTFQGQAVIGTDVLIKYTYYGDANLDGQVDGSDYSLVDNSYNNEHFVNGVATTSISGWYNGDFNYDGVVDGSDYTLMDNAFNSQGAQFTAQVSAQIAGSGATSAVPEPAAVGLVAMATAGVLGRRRGRTVN
jgi:autotransporter-associated beta strand protein